MLVIEGFAGKSLAVGNYIEKLNTDKILVVNNDSSIISSISRPNSEFYVITYHGEITDVFIDNFVKHTKASEYKFEHVIFYLNTTREYIDMFKSLEDRIGANVVLTVQAPDRENSTKVNKYIV